jgi:hypothetical protein
MTKDRPRVRITDQFRKGQAMVYDLACDDFRLTIEVTARENSDGLGEWNVGAHASKASEGDTIKHPGVTRGDALGAVARSWATKQGTTHFPTLDWAAVTQALLAVRAV